MTSYSVVKKSAIAMVMVVLVSCQGNQGETSASDSTMVSDSMGIVKPPLQDSSGIIHTPPIQDSNAILPDSAIR